MLKLERKSLGYENVHKYNTLKDVAPFLQVLDLFFLSIWFFQTGKIPLRTERIFFFFPFLQKVTVLHSLPELAMKASISELLQIKFRDNINMLVLIKEKVKSKVRYTREILKTSSQHSQQAGIIFRLAFTFSNYNLKPNSYSLHIWGCGWKENS